MANVLYGKNLKLEKKQTNYINIHLRAELGLLLRYFETFETGINFESQSQDELII